MMFPNMQEHVICSKLDRFLLSDGWDYFWIALLSSWSLTFPNGRNSFLFENIQIDHFLLKRILRSNGHSFVPRV